MIVLKTPKGWTGPKVVDGLQVEGTWRAHQVPISNARGNPEHLRLLEEWMRSYRPEELFDDNGTLDGGTGRAGPRIVTEGWARTRTPTAACCSAISTCPISEDYAVEVGRPGASTTEGTRPLGKWLRDVIERNPATFRLFGPDETASNRLQGRVPGDEPGLRRGDPAHR